MIEPVLSGSALSEDINATQPGDDHVALWWLGQSGFVLRWSDVVLVLDPYLTDHLAGQPGDDGARHARQTPALLAPSELGRADLVAVTNGSPDHLDPVGLPALLKAAPGALLVLPAPLADYAADELHVSDHRLVPIHDGEVFDLRGLRLHAVPASLGQSAPQGDDLAELGYVVRAGGMGIYAAGDTVPYRTQVERLAPFQLQVALLPVNGRDARRQSLGRAGNLTCLEAGRLAHELRVDAAVPCHWDMFAYDGADVEACCEAAAHAFPGVRFDVLLPGQRWLYPAEPL